MPSGISIGRLARFNHTLLPTGLRNFSIRSCVILFFFLSVASSIIYLGGKLSLSNIPLAKIPESWRQNNRTSDVPKNAFTNSHPNLGNLDRTTYLSAEYLQAHGLPNKAGRAENLRNKAKYPNLSKTLVLASQSRDGSLTWLDEVSDLYDIKRYVVDDPNAEYTIPSHYGMESMVYLTYIIDHYDQLADTTTFHHFHKFSYMHEPIPDTEAQVYLRRLQHYNVYDSLGYRNIQCEDGWGCNSGLGINPSLDPGRYWVDRFYADAWLEMWPNDPVPDHMGTPCCTQFVASRDAIRNRTLEEYISYRDWLINLPNQRSVLNVDAAEWGDEDYDYVLTRRAGYFFEYLWQWIIMHEPVVCPSALTCACSMFGNCFDTIEHFHEFLAMPTVLEQKKYALQVLTESLDEVKQDLVSQVEQASASEKDSLTSDLEAFERKYKETIDAEEAAVMEFSNRIDLLGQPS